MMPSLARIMAGRAEAIPVGDMCQESAQIRWSRSGLSPPGRNPRAARCVRYDMRLVIAFAALWMAACSPGPVDPEVEADDERAAADASPAPAGGAVAAANQRAAVPLAGNGPAWSWDSATGSARFGP